MVAWLPVQRSVLTRVLVVSSGTVGQSRAGFDKCLQVGEGWSVFSFVGKHQCFSSETSGNNTAKSWWGRMWEDCKQVLQLQFWIRCRGRKAHRWSRPARCELQESNLKISRDYSSTWVTSGKKWPDPSDVLKEKPTYLSQDSSMRRKMVGCPDLPQGCVHFSGNISAQRPYECCLVHLIKKIYIYWLDIDIDCFCCCSNS